MNRLVLALGVLVALGCSGETTSNRSPAGTPTDPVEVCERLADVCRLETSKLGVCTQPMPGTEPASCAGRKVCLICAPQH